MRVRVDPIQWELGKLEKQADKRHIKFSQDKSSCVSGEEEPLAVIQAGNWLADNSSAENVPGILQDRGPGEAGSADTQEGLQEQKANPRSEGRDCPPQLCTHQPTPRVCFPGLAPQCRQTWIKWSTGSPRWRGGWSTPHVLRGQGTCTCSAWQREGSGGSW